MSVSVKREAGEKPARSRRCERGVLLPLRMQRSVTESRKNSWEDEAGR